MISPGAIRWILSEVQYKDWELVVGVDGDRQYLQWRFRARCSKTGEVCEQSGRKWQLSPHMTRSELISTAFKAALTAEEHECRENFRWRKRRIFNPHADVLALWLACEKEDVRDLPA